MTFHSTSNDQIFNNVTVIDNLVLPRLSTLPSPGKVTYGSFFLNGADSNLYYKGTNATKLVQVSTNGILSYQNFINTTGSFYINNTPPTFILDPNSSSTIIGGNSGVSLIAGAPKGRRKASSHGRAPY